MRTIGRSGLVALGMLLFCGVLLAGDPDEIVLDLNPGETTEIECTVSIPCDTSPPKADIYILADTSGSMGAILSAIVDTADELVDTLLGTTGVDVQIGVGNYRDFPLDPYCYEHQVSITDDGDAVKDAFGDWVAVGGGDKSEGEFYAITKMLRDPATGFRKGDDVKRILVWFGDAPSHDAICEDIHNDPEIDFDITEETVTADLLASGFGGTTVIAISTRIGIPGALDADPNLFADDYIGICDVSGVEGQATRITDATSGIHILDLPSPKEITPAILEAVETVLRRTDVTIDVTGEIEGFVTNIEPESYMDVVVPTCPEEDVELTFTITLEGQGCIENKNEYLGEITTLIDEKINEVKPVRITQSECAQAVCYLVIGARTAEIRVGRDPHDVLLVKPKRPKNDWVIPITRETMPTFKVPKDPKLVGKHMYMQVYMNNPIDFPRNPVQVSNGVDITLGSTEMPVPYGPANTIQLWGVTPAPLGGELELTFDIDGL